MKTKILFLIGVSIAACFEVHSQIVSIETARKVASATKILRDGQLFIILGDKIYTTTGQEVK